MEGGVICQDLEDMAARWEARAEVRDSARADRGLVRADP